ncbi:DNA polymerase IV [Bacillus atrophaeus]|uniref:DNA polymerase IV n=1 Tax=Bacillus atrophaeus TaxID=1452 RepID=UPI002E22FFC0|nr:DNA polymerase IV [Bacillus atrophaeus]MED1032494.1 DNA polymerase IV [Bacillus atrophaeus]MED1120963.1 DNA polymerase IV [Bacillus atrophaeus]
MIDYSSLPKRAYLTIDMRSFYASASAVMMGLDPMKCYLAVVGNTERSGSVVLAASPALKRKYGIGTGSRLYEIPEDPEIYIVNPQMKMFIRLSANITRLFYQYAAPEDILTFSIDESLVRVDHLKKLWGSPVEIAKKIQAAIYRDFGVPSAVGIGPNMLMSKLALDLEAKKSPSGIAEWTYKDVKTKLWPIRPLSQMWGIGRRMEHNLNRMGISTVGQLANYPLERLEKRFGIMGSQIYYHAHGVDMSKIEEPMRSGQITFGKSQILLRDYDNPEEVRMVILEMCEEVARRARKAKKAGRTISLGIGYSKTETGGGFHRSVSLDQPTNVTMEIFKACLKLFRRFYRDQTVRSISVSLSNIIEDNQLQLNLFEQDSAKKRELGYVMDSIRQKYGSGAILRAVSYTEAGTAVQRNKLVGGHQA